MKLNLHTHTLRLQWDPFPNHTCKMAWSQVGSQASPCGLMCRWFSLDKNQRQPQHSIIKSSTFLCLIIGSVTWEMIIQAEKQMRRPYESKGVSSHTLGGKVDPQLLPRHWSNLATQNIRDLTLQNHPICPMTLWVQPLFIETTHTCSPCMHFYLYMKSVV